MIFCTSTHSDEFTGMATHWVCSRPKGHVGDHLAIAAGYEWASWPQAEPHPMDMLGRDNLGRRINGRQAIAQQAQAKGD
jgi:hypothetical protein